MGTTIRHRRGSQVSRIPVKPKPCQGHPISSVLPSNCWAGQTCFIIGGGPSLHNFNWSLLEGYKVIGINKAFQTYPAVDVNFGIDYRFFEALQYSSDPKHPDYQLHLDWIKFSGVRAFVRHSPSEKFVSGIHYVTALQRKAISFDLDAGIYPTNNSGGGALLLAVALGCRRIGLLGYDFKIQGTRTHYHSGYRSQDPDHLAKKLEDFRGKVDEWASGLSTNGIQVVNLSPDSALRNYPKSDIHTFLGESV